MIKQWLLSHPDEQVSASNELALEWMKDLGLDEDYPPMADQMPLICGSKAHPTHWLMFGNLHDAKLNFYHFVECFPRSKFTEEQVKGLYSGKDMLPLLRKPKGTN